MRKNVTSSVHALSQFWFGLVPTISGCPKVNNTWSVTEAQIQLEYLLEIRSDYFIPFLFRNGTKQELAFARTFDDQIA